MTKSWASSPAVRKAMIANRSTGTKPEVALQQALKDALPSRTVRFNVLHLPGTPDVVISNKIAIFADGCYWHGCPRHGSVPKTNKKYWTTKFKHNADRDKRVNSELRFKCGMAVYRIWECRIRSDLAGVVRIIDRAVRRGPKPCVSRLAPWRT